MIVYKIKRLYDNKYSVGGMTPSFNNTGKIWKQKGHLTNHLRQAVYGAYYNNEYENCIIVECELSEKEKDFMSVQEYLNERQMRLEEQEKRLQKIKEEQEREYRWKLFQELKAEFGE